MLVSVPPGLKHNGTMETEPIPSPVKWVTFLEYLGIYPLIIEQYILKKSQNSKKIKGRVVQLCPSVFVVFKLIRVLSQSLCFFRIGLYAVFWNIQSLEFFFPAGTQTHGLLNQPEKDESGRGYPGNQRGDINYLQY